MDLKSLERVQCLAALVHSYLGPAALGLSHINAYALFSARFQWKNG